MKFKLLLNSLVVTVLFFILIGGLTFKAQASEGIVELKNLAGGNSRCFAASVLMQNFDYKILVSCRDLIYPGGQDVFSYSLWASEAGNDKVHKLGSLGFGKGEYSIKKPFDQLFVTLENSDNARKPSDRLVMSGEVKKIESLEEGAQVEAETAEQDTVEDVTTPVEEEVPFINTDQLTNSTSGQGSFSLLKLVGGILVGVIVFVVIVALVSASRRRPIE